MPAGNAAVTGGPVPAAVAPGFGGGGPGAGEVEVEDAIHQLGAQRGAQALVGDDRPCELRDHARQVGAQLSVAVGSSLGAEPVRSGGVDLERVLAGDADEDPVERLVAARADEDLVVDPAEERLVAQLAPGPGWSTARP